MAEFTHFKKDGSAVMVDVHEKPDIAYVLDGDNNEKADGKIAEVRSYYHGIFHGEWRTYSDNGQLIGLASYKEGQKDGPWRIWSDKGNLLYEMFYTAGKKSGVWRSWDEEGNLLSEENQ